MATLYWVIGTTSGWTTPTALQITQGKVASGSAAPWSGSETDPGTDGYVLEQTTIYNFASATNYTLAWVWAEGTNYSDIVTYTFTSDTIPVLSGITLINIGTTFGTPRVTITIS
jgi:hypothetical protein